MKVKSDHRSKFCNLSNWKEETWKKIRASTGFEPLTYAIPVRCSTNWPMKPHTGSEVNLLRSYLLRSLSPQIFHSHFVIRILSSAFFYPPSAAIRSVLYRDPPETAWKKKAITKEVWNQQYSPKTFLSTIHKRFQYLLTVNIFISQTNISFIENGSMVRGAAIYVPSLQRCSWTKEFPHHDFKTALRWSGNIVYKKNYLFTKALSGSAYDITTDTKGFHLHFPKDVKVMVLEVFIRSLY